MKYLVQEPLCCRGQYGEEIIKAVVTKLLVGFECLPSLEVRELAVSMIDSMIMNESCQAVEDLLKLMKDVRVHLLVLCICLTPSPPIKKICNFSQH